MASKKGTMATKEVLKMEDGDLSEVKYKYKILLMGDGGVGKTSFIRRHVMGDFLKSYETTCGAEVNPLVFSTTKGKVLFEVWDIAGQQTKSAILADLYYAKADGVILMFDLTSKVTYKNVPEWHSHTRKVLGDLPAVLVGNKIDVKEKDRKLRMKNMDYQKKVKIPYFAVSAKSNYNIELPFLALARALVGEEKLEFVAVPEYEEPEIVMEPEEIEQLSKELEEIQLQGAAGHDQEDL